MTHPMYLANKASTLKRTLDTILVDKAMTSKLILNKYCESRDMTDAYHDDLDVAGPGLASMKPEALEKMTSGIPLRRLGKPMEIAHSVAYILENDYFTGRVLELDGGLRL